MEKEKKPNVFIGGKPMGYTTDQNLPKIDFTHTQKVQIFPTKEERQNAVDKSRQRIMTNNPAQEGTAEHSLDTFFVFAEEKEIEEYIEKGKVYNHQIVFDPSQGILNIPSARLRTHTPSSIKHIKIDLKVSDVNNDLLYKMIYTENQVIEDIKKEMSVKTFRGQEIDVEVHKFHPSQHTFDDDMYEGQLTICNGAVIDIDDHGMYAVCRYGSLKQIKQDLLHYAEEIRRREDS